MSAGSGSSGCFRHLDAVAADHLADELGMPRLLEALQVDRLAQHGIVDGMGEFLDDGAGAQLRVQHLLPERHRAQPLQRRVVELGPGQLRRHVVLIGRLEMPAEQLLVRLGADLHRGASLAHEAAREAHQARHHARAQQARIVAGEPAVVLGEADLHQLRRRDVDADRLAAGHGEVVVLRGAPPRPRAMPMRSQIRNAQTASTLSSKQRPPPPRQVAAMPGDPVDEEE